MGACHGRRQRKHFAQDRMIAVAAGDAGVVCEWGVVLTAASIPFRLAIPCEGGDYAELWVDSDDAEEARASLLSATAGRRHIW